MVAGQAERQDRSTVREDLAMKNRSIDLHNHLISQLERLGDEDLDEDTLAMEVSRSKAIAGVAREIIAHGRLALDYEVARSEHEFERVVPMLESDDGGT